MNTYLYWLEKVVSQLTKKNSTLIMSFSLDSTLAPKFEARVESWKFASYFGARVELTQL